MMLITIFRAAHDSGHQALFDTDGAECILEVGGLQGQDVHALDASLLHRGAVSLPVP